MPDEAMSIPHDLSVQAGQLPHQEQVSAEKWGHTFTKIAYVTAVVAVVAFTVAVVAAAIFFTGGGALPVFIALGAVAALSGGGAILAKLFQNKFAEKANQPQDDNTVASRLYEVLGEATTAKDIQTAIAINKKDNENFSALLDQVKRRNGGEKIDKEVITEAAKAIQNPSNVETTLLRSIVDQTRTPATTLPYANLIQRLQTLQEERYDSAAARKLLHQFRAPIDQVRVATVLRALEAAKGDAAGNIRSIGDALLDSTGGSKELDAILFKLVAKETHLDFRPIIGALRGINLPGLFGRDTVYACAKQAVAISASKLDNLKNVLEQNFPDLPAEQRDKLFNAIVNFKAIHAWDNYIDNLINVEGNLAERTSEFLKSLQQYPASSNPLEAILEVSGDKAPPFLSVDEIEKNLDSLPAGPLFLAVKDESGKYIIKEFLVQKSSDGYPEYKHVGNEFYALKMETRTKRLVEVIKLPEDMLPDVLGQTARGVKDPKTSEAVELAYKARVHVLDKEKSLKSELESELNKHDIADTDKQFLLENYKSYNEQNELIHMLQSLRITEGSNERAYHVIKATTPFFTRLVASNDFERSGNALAIISKLITPKGQLVPYRYNEALAAVKKIGLKPGDIIPLIKAGDAGEPVLLNLKFQGDRLVPDTGLKDVSRFEKSKLLFAYSEPFNLYKVRDGKADVVTAINQNMINKDFDDPTLKIQGTVNYNVNNRNRSTTQIQLPKQFENEISRYTTITIDGKTYRNPQEIAQALYTACDDDVEKLQHLVPFLSQAAIASGADKLFEIKEEGTLPKQKSITLSVDSSGDAIKVTLETLYDITGNPERVLLAEYATTKTAILYKEELKSGNAQRSRGSELLRRLPKSSRQDDFDLILSKAKPDEVQGFKEDLGELETIFLDYTNRGVKVPELLNEKLQSLLGKLHRSKMSQTDKRLVLAAIHRLSTPDARSGPISYAEALKYNEDPSKMYMIEVGTNRQLILRQGTKELLEADSNHPIVTNKHKEDAGNELVNKSSKYELEIQLDPIEIYNHLQSAVFQLGNDPSTKQPINGVILDSAFIKDAHRTVFSINGKICSGNEAAQLLSDLINDPEAMHYLSMLLNQSMMALPSLTIFGRIVTEIMNNNIKGDIKKSGVIFEIKIEGDSITAFISEESALVDGNGIPMKNIVYGAELRLNKEMLRSHNFKGAQYIIRQKNIPLNDPLNSFEFLPNEFHDYIPLLQTHLTPFHIALLKDYLAYKESIGIHPTDEQLAKLLEKHSAFLLSTINRNDEDLLAILNKITSFPDISIRLPVILKHYRGDTVRFYDYNYLSLPVQSAFKVDKSDPERPSMHLVSEDFSKPRNENLKGVLRSEEKYPDQQLKDFNNRLLKSPKYIVKTPINLSNGKTISYPEASKKYLDSANFYIEGITYIGESAIDGIYDLAGENQKITEGLLTFATEEMEKSLLIKAQQWADVNYNNSVKVRAAFSSHSFHKEGDKLVYKLTLRAEAEVNGKLIQFDLTRNIDFNEDKLKEGIVEAASIQDIMDVSK